MDRQLTEADKVTVITTGLENCSLESTASTTTPWRSRSVAAKKENAMENATGRKILHLDEPPSSKNGHEKDQDVELCFKNQKNIGYFKTGEKPPPNTPSPLVSYKISYFYTISSYNL
jgi:hypothetical protein